MRAPRYSDWDTEIFSDPVIDQPHTMYTRLREATPLSRIGESGFHLVSHWDLIEEVLNREEDFSANLTGVLYEANEGQPGAFELPGARTGCSQCDCDCR